MRKLVFALSIAAVFFYIGRTAKSPIAPRSNSHSLHGEQAAQTIGHTVEATDSQEMNQSESTAANNLQWRPKQLAELLLTEQDSKLFQILYSQDFKINWKANIAELSQRLLAKIPNAKSDQVNFDKEIVARTGILKALANSAKDNDPELKQLLYSVLSQTQHLPWTLQREAVHTLISKNDLSEKEETEAMKFLDPRSRNTASLSDREILDRTFEGNE